MRIQTLVLSAVVPVMAGSVTLARDVEPWAVASELASQSAFSQVVADMFRGDNGAAPVVAVEQTVWSAFAVSESNAPGVATSSMSGEVSTRVSNPTVFEFSRTSGGSGLDNPTFPELSGSSTRVSGVASSGGGGVETLIPLPTPMAMGVAGLALVAGVRRRRTVRA